jgi:hypothetical protein
MLRVQAVNVYPQAIGALLEGEGGFGRWLVVADGDPIRPPLRVFAEAGADVDTAAAEARLHGALRTAVTLTRVEPGTLPVAEHKTRTVYRTARGDEPPVRSHR